MAIVYFLCGLPASGKTTFAKQLKQEKGVVRLTLDERMRTKYSYSIFDEEYGHLAAEEKEQMWEEAKEYLSQGREVPMPTPTDHDSSNGYEAVASEFMTRREQSGIGVATVRAWARSLKPGASILDLGCGHGVPISAALMDDGFAVYGIEASPSLTTAFRSRFPQAHVACEAIEDSSFFCRKFDAVIAVGLMFLLSANIQDRLIRRVAQTLNSGGRFLFTSPAEACTWKDVLTGQQSLSLGAETYKDLLSNAGLALVDEYLDEGDNHYYYSRKR